MSESRWEALKIWAQARAKDDYPEGSLYLSFTRLVDEMREIEARLAEPAPAQSRVDGEFSARELATGVVDSVIGAFKKYHPCGADERVALIDAIEAAVDKHDAALRSRQPSAPADDKTRRCSICGAAITRLGYCAHSAACVDAAEVDPNCEDTAPQPSPQGEDVSAEPCRPKKELWEEDRDGVLAINEQLKAENAQLRDRLASLDACLAIAESKEQALKHTIADLQAASVGVAKDGREIREVVRSLVDYLKHAEWGSTEQAERILITVIDRYMPEARAVLERNHD